MPTQNKRLQFRIKELMAQMERKTGHPVTYESIREATGLSPNTLSLLATGKAKMVGIASIERLLAFFNCAPGDLMVWE
jgi:DNA-binding Xre family transcriptional regulator